MWTSSSFKNMYIICAVVDAVIYVRAHTGHIMLKCQCLAGYFYLYAYIFYSSCSGYRETCTTAGLILQAITEWETATANIIKAFNSNLKLGIQQDLQLMLIFE